MAHHIIYTASSVHPICAGVTTAHLFCASFPFLINYELNRVRKIGEGEINSAI